ncbi:MAG: arylesterase [Bdellovibrio sp.]|nr:arylesterase [Methylotenera sp.]
MQAKQTNDITNNIATKTTIARTQTILVFGDSLSAGYGLTQDQGWVVLLGQQLAQNKLGKLSYKVVNASISGETTSGGLARFSAALATHKPNIVILELGANDGLRGLPINEMQTNLSQMIVQAKTAKAKVLLVGMKIPPNYGLKYSKNFSATYSNLANQHHIALVPFLLEGVAGKPELTQADGLHPLVIAQPQLLENVWGILVKMLNNTVGL